MRICTLMYFLMFTTAVRFLEYPLPFSDQVCANTAFSPGFPAENMAPEFYAPFFEEFYEGKSVSAILLGDPHYAAKDAFPTILYLSASIMRKYLDGKFPYSLFFKSGSFGAYYADLLSPDAPAGARDYHRFLVDNLVVLCNLLQSLPIDESRHYELDLELVPTSFAHRSFVCKFSFFLLNFRLLDEHVIGLLDASDALRNRRFSSCIPNVFPVDIQRDCLVAVLFLDSHSEECVIEYFNQLRELRFMASAPPNLQKLKRLIEQTEAELSCCVYQTTSAMKPTNADFEDRFNAAAVDSLKSRYDPEEIAQILLREPIKQDARLEMASCLPRTQLNKPRRFDPKFDAGKLAKSALLRDKSLYEFLLHEQRALNKFITQPNTARPPCQAAIEAALFASFEAAEVSVRHIAFGVRRAAILRDSQKVERCGIKFVDGLPVLGGKVLNIISARPAQLSKAYTQYFRIAGFGLQDAIQLNLSDGEAVLAIEGVDAFVKCLPSGVTAEI